MKDYCWDCKYRKNCDLADNINFCVDCKDYYTCDICYSDCKAGYAVECNNGFEPKEPYDEEEYE